MGGAAVLPGFSASTVLFMTGRYDDFLNTLKNLNPHGRAKKLVKRELRIFDDDLRFLGSLSIGIVIGGIFLSGIAYSLVENFVMPTYLLFTGLLLGTGFFSLKENVQLEISSLGLVVVGFGLSLAVSRVSSVLDGFGMVFVIFAGFLAALAFLLPGLSGSGVLLIMGVYEKAIGAISTLISPPFSLKVSALRVITLLGAGFSVGFVLGIHTYGNFLDEHPEKFLAVVSGLIFGASVITIENSGIVSGGDPLMVASSVMVGLIGLGVIAGLDRRYGLLRYSSSDPVA